MSNRLTRKPVASKEEIAKVLAEVRVPSESAKQSTLTTPEPIDVVAADVSIVKSESLFDDLDAPEEEVVRVRPADGIAVDSDLTPSEREEFARIINKMMPLQERALQLTKLARFTDQKRAAVGLRALQEIAAITGTSAEAPRDAPPMFALPPGTSISVKVEKQVK